MTNRHLFVVSLVAFGISSAAQANVIWRGDFETGNLSQWSGAQLVSPDRAVVVTSPVAQGKYAVRITVKQGDNPINASGNRNELEYLSYEASGTERWYRWQTMFDQSFPDVPTWQLFTQFHHSGSNGSPPVEFYVYSNEIRLRLDASTIVWTHPLVRGVWHDFVFHVKWSPSASEGFVELYFDGQLVLPKMMAATQYAGMTNYLKQGLYRDASVTQDGIVYHDGTTIGETRDDVWPAGSTAGSGTTSPADAGTPVADAGNPSVDAGHAAADAGAPVVGTRDAGMPVLVDAGSEPAPAVDAGTAPVVADASTPGTGTTPPAQNVGCSGTPGALLFPGAFLLVGLCFRRRD